MIAKSGLISYFAQQAPPGAAHALPGLAKPQVVIVKPELPHAAEPPIVVKPPPEPRSAVKVEKDDRVTGRCRILLNEAQREIDRLRRSLGAQVKHEIDVREVEIPRESPASEQTERKTYAVDPIGMPAVDHREKPPRVVPGPKVVTRPHVTNVGTLLDVLI